MSTAGRCCGPSVTSWWRRRMTRPSPRTRARATGFMSGDRRSGLCESSPRRSMHAYAHGAARTWRSTHTHGAARTHGAGRVRGPECTHAAHGTARAPSLPARQAKSRMHQRPLTRPRASPTHPKPPRLLTTGRCGRPTVTAGTTSGCAPLTRRVSWRCCRTRASTLDSRRAGGRRISSRTSGPEHATAWARGGAAAAPPCWS